MQIVIVINSSCFSRFAEAVFEGEAPLVYSAYSDFGQELKQFDSPEAIAAQLIRCMEGKDPFFNFAVWYPSVRGHVERRRISLDPRKCYGHTFRYAVGGWGVIQLQFDFKRLPDVKCRVAVNSGKRAKLWQAHYPSLGPVSEWNWKAVEKHARRIIRKVKALAKQIPPGVSRQLPN